MIMRSIRLRKSEKFSIISLNPIKMEGFGNKIHLLKTLDEDLVPAYTGFESTHSENDISTDLEEIPSEGVPPQITSESSISSSSGRKSGISQIIQDFQILKQNISIASSQSFEEQKLVASSIVSKLVSSNIVGSLYTYYNLNSHLIAPAHVFKMTLELGENPTQNQVFIWQYRLEGIVMEKQMNRDTEYLELKNLCKKTCKDVQSLVIDSRGETSQFQTLVAEAKQVQVVTHDTLIQLQEIINEQKVPSLPSSVIRNDSQIPLTKEWKKPPMKIIWGSNLVKVFLSPYQGDIPLDEIKDLAKLVKKFNLGELQIMSHVSFDQLFGAYSVMNNKDNKSELIELLTTFSS